MFMILPPVLWYLNLFSIKGIGHNENIFAACEKERKKKVQCLYSAYHNISKRFTILEAR